MLTAEPEEPLAVDVEATAERTQEGDVADDDDDDDDDDSAAPPPIVDSDPDDEDETA